MSRKRAASPTHIEDFDDDFDEDSPSSGKCLRKYFNLFSVISEYFYFNYQLNDQTRLQ